MVGLRFRSKTLALSPALSMALLCSSTWATFSIVAVDTQTREVGSAGASCLDDQDVAGGVLIISDVFPGKGAIHTQAQYNATNKQNARNRMTAGDSPTQIISWLSQNDVQNNAAIRQYGIVDLNQGLARSAGFTGANCMDWKGHLTGANYAIQGNILAFQGNTAQGNRILDSMQARFSRTSGTLADKLMAAMQGANRPGADNRCLSEGVSSQSAFLRVARPTDAPTALYLDLRVTRRPVGREPIDSLQKLYDRWRAALPVEKRGGVRAPIRMTRIPGAWRLQSNLLTHGERVAVSVSTLFGKTAYAAEMETKTQNAWLDLPRRFQPGLYLIQIKTRQGSALHKAFLN